MLVKYPVCPQCVTLDGMMVLWDKEAYVTYNI